MAVPRPAYSFLLIVVLAGVLLTRESRQPAGSLAGMDRAFFDWLAVNSFPGRYHGEPAVTFVEIDDTVANTPGRLPLGPLDYAAFLQSVGKYHPQVVAIVPVLEWAQAAPGSDQILLDQALGVSRLLLAARLGSSVENSRDAASLPALSEVHGNTTLVPDFPEVVGAPSAALLIEAAATGATNLPGNEKAPLRDVPLVFRCRDRVVPSFGLQLLTLALRLSPTEVSVTPGDSVQLGDHFRLPIDRAGRALIDPNASRILNRLTLDDLALAAAGQASPETRAAAERMRGGVVLLGRTDQAIRAFHLPDGRLVPLTEVFALTVASLSCPPVIHAAGWGWNAVLIAGFALLGWTLRRLRRSTAVGLCVATLAVYALAALAIFEGSGLWLPLALPTGLTLLDGLLLWLLGPQNLEAQA